MEVNLNYVNKRFKFTVHKYKPFSIFKMKAKTTKSVLKHPRETKFKFFLFLIFGSILLIFVNFIYSALHFPNILGIINL